MGVAARDTGFAEEVRFSAGFLVRGSHDIAAVEGFNRIHGFEGVSDADGDAVPELVIRVGQDEQPAHLAPAFCRLKKVFFRRQRLGYAHDEEVSLLCGDLDAGDNNNVQIVGFYVFHGICRALDRVMVDYRNGIKPYRYCPVYYILYSALAVA